MKAELVGQMTDWLADARVYKLDPPYEYRDYDDEVTQLLEYVIVSAVVVAFTGEPETLIFPCRQLRTPMSPRVPMNDGGTLCVVNVSYEPINMIEIVGRRGTLNHEELLKELGYEV